MGSGCSIKKCCLMVTTTPVPTTTPCPTHPPTEAPSPCTTAAYRLYSNQIAVAQKAQLDSKDWMMPSMGMFAFFAIGGLAAGLGVSAYRRIRRNKREIIPLQE